jgi:NIMA (never in mitosis gene a)-related kinase 1/4/5
MDEKEIWRVMIE